MPGLAQPGGGLCPAEGLLDALSDDLADLVSGMAGRASVDGGGLDLSRDVRGDVEGAKLSDEVLGVVALVGPQRDAARSIGAGFDHVEGRDALGVAVRHGQAGVDHQPVAVLHQGMADEAELRLTAGALAVEPGIRVGGALMSVVGAALAVESLSRLRPWAGGSPEPSFGLTLFIEAHASIMVPSTLKCSVDRRRFTFGWASTAARNLCATSPASSRSRFLPKLVCSQTASSTPSPTNQRNRRS